MMENYIPTGEALRIVSRTDELLIWDRCAEDGCDKDVAIFDLYHENKIALESYCNGCPYCHDLSCSDCTRPGGICLLAGRLYKEWSHEPTTRGRSIFAKKMFDYIYNNDI